MVANMAFCSAFGIVSVFSSVGFSLRQRSNAPRSLILASLAKSFLGFDAKRSQNEERGRGLRQGFAVATACYLRRRLKPALLNGDDLLGKNQEQRNAVFSSTGIPACAASCYVGRVAKQGNQRT